MKITLAVFLTIIPLYSFSQNFYSQKSYYENSKKASFWCGEIVNDNTPAAKASVELILKEVDIRPNFILRACSKKLGAAAATRENQRFIMYNIEFMSDIYNNSDAWGYIFVLAHEIGHHLKNHTVDLVLADFGVGCEYCEFARIPFVLP
ncbi:MAG TPA: hypothetical protein EYQ51_09630 [Alphaproteobacteria bacterium]|nr:hypothetical protein [Alphaproteobacteria bacterium]